MGYSNGASMNWNSSADLLSWMPVARRNSRSSRSPTSFLHLRESHPMRPEGVTAKWFPIDPWMRGALCLYLFMFVATGTRSVLQPHRGSLYPVWKLAGHDWLTGHDLYGDSSRCEYRYSPLVAGFFTMCDLIPDGVGNVGWRFINLVSFLAALAWWLNKGLPFAFSPARRGVVFLLAAPLAMGSLNNGQVNLLLIALMLVSVTASALGRWNIAALCLAAAIMFKIYPLALAILLILVYPRQLGLRVLFALALLAVLPFLMQDPEYVLRQYQLWYGRVSHGDSARRYWDLVSGYRDVWQLIRAWELPMTLHQYTRLQLAGGGFCAALTLLAALRLPKSRETLFVVFTLAMIWMLLFGPAPESCTYVLAAPTLGVWLLHTAEGRNRSAHYLSACGYGLLILCVIAGTHSPLIRLYQASGLQPLGLILYGVGFVGSIMDWLLRPNRPVVEPDLGENATSLSQAA
jgi:hypothetical protein